MCGATTCDLLRLHGQTDDAIDDPPRSLARVTYNTFLPDGTAIAEAGGQLSGGWQLNPPPAGTPPVSPGPATCPAPRTLHAQSGQTKLPVGDGPGKLRLPRRGHCGRPRNPTPPTPGAGTPATPPVRAH